MSVAVKSKYKFILTFHLFSSYSLPQRIRQTHLETNYILYFPFTFMVEEWRLTYTTVLFLFLLFLPLSHTDVWTHALTFSLPSIATRLFSCWWSQAQRGCYISRWLSSAKASPTDTHASTGHTYSHPCTCRSPRMQDVCSQMSSLQKTCCLLISTHTYTLFLSHLQILI